MKENETETKSTIRKMWQRILEKKNLFLIAIPSCLVVSYALLLLVPKKYESSVQIAAERQDARNSNRAMILHQSTNYDLGLAPTDNAVTIYGLQAMAKSPQITCALFDKQVRTAKGDWEGRISDYFTQYTGKRGNEMPKVNAPAKNSVVANRNQDKVRQSITMCIKTKIDANAEILTIAVRTSDPLVSAMMAQYILDELAAQVQAYQLNKLSNTLSQMEQLAQEAELAYDTAVKEHTSDAQIKEDIWKSFSRQQVVCAAQMIKQASFVTLVSPMADYQAVSPHKTIGAVVITMLLTMGMVLVVCRKELLESL